MNVLKYQLLDKIIHLANDGGQTKNYLKIEAATWLLYWIGMHEP